MVTVLFILQMLIFSSSLRVLKPEHMQGIYSYSAAEFGPQISTFMDPIEGELVLLQGDLLGCTPIEEIVHGKILLILRGDCSYEEKIRNAQAAGAQAVIVGSNVGQALLIPMSARDELNISIPAVSVSNTTFKKFSVHLKEKGPLIVSLNGDGEVKVRNQLSLLELGLYGILFLLAIITASFGIYLVGTKARDTILEALARRRRFAEISNFPLLRYSNIKKSYRKIHNDSCSVCLEDFYPTDSIKLLPCSHGFHPNCVDKWLIKKGKCPLCIQSII